MQEQNRKLRWWEGNVDETLIGLFIAAVAITAILFLNNNGKEVAISAISALGVYLGMKSNK